MKKKKKTNKQKMTHPKRRPKKILATVKIVPTGLDRVREGKSKKKNPFKKRQNSSQVNALKLVNNVDGI